VNYAFSPAARIEFEQAIDYYESRQRGLGEQLSIEVESAVERILQYPTSWTRVDAIFHRCLTKRFPYGIIYSIENGVVRITAIMNLHRKPDYWKSQ
jgi:plasmid stabilization system protein ParE